MSEEPTKQEMFFFILQKHPVLIFTLLVLICSTIGYWSEYLLFKKFGLNFVAFAEATDFFLAGLKNPILLIIIFPMFVVFTYILMYKIEVAKETLADELKNENADIKYIILRKKKEIYKLAALLIIIFLVLTFSIIQAELDRKYKNIKNNPKYNVAVSLTNGSSILGTDNSILIFITATTKFIFFYKKKITGQWVTIVVPINSISSISSSIAQAGTENIGNVYFIDNSNKESFSKCNSGDEGHK